MPFRLGFLVNPIAGLGGAVGLKGSDGSLARRALSMGASPLAPGRACLALSKLYDKEECTGAGKISVVTCPGVMGADVAAAAGFVPVCVADPPGDPSSADDTRRVADALIRHGVDLILFAGGDGTARVLLDTVGDRVPVLGIPAGVKMHSAVFATTPAAAARAVVAYMDANRRGDLLRLSEVMDRPLGSAGGSPVLYGYMKVPYVPLLVQWAKASTRTGEDAMQAGAIRHICRLAADGRMTLLGPGTTLHAVKRDLGFDGTLLGVDLVCRGRLIATDLGAGQILTGIGDMPARLVVSVIGGQGFLFGRGNQQFSPAVIRRVGIPNIVITASMEKLLALPDRTLLCDTGDPSLDRDLSGFRPVLTGPGRTTMVRVAAT